MAKLILTIGLCLLAVVAYASGVAYDFSIGDNYPADDGPTNLHFSISVPEDEPDTWADYGVIIYYKSPWRLHRSGSDWSPQTVAGGKVFLIPPNQPWGFYDVTLPCFVCTGGIPGDPEQPIQPTPWTREINLRVPFQNYPWSDGTVTAEVWRSYPPPNPIVPGHYSLCYRKTIKVNPGHMHYVHRDIPREATGWIPNGVIEALQTVDTIAMVTKHGLLIAGEKAGGGAICKKLRKKIMQYLLKHAGHYVDDGAEEVLFAVLVAELQGKRWTRDYRLVCCHGDEPDFKQVYDEFLHPYWAPDTLDFQAMLQRERLHLSVGAEGDVFEENIDLGYTYEETTSHQSFHGKYWWFCIDMEGAINLPTEWWTSEEKNYQYIGPQRDYHPGPCGAHPVHYPVYTSHPDAYSPFPPPDQIE